MNKRNDFLCIGAVHPDYILKLKNNYFKNRTNPIIHYEKLGGVAFNVASKIAFLNEKIELNSINCNSRDKNFLLKLKNKPSYIIKISNPAESISLLKLQDFVLKNLIKRNSVSNFIPKKIHSSIKVYQDQLNRDCCVRVLSFIEGKMYAVVNHNKNLET